MIYITLTTVPDRWVYEDSFLTCLASLLNQTFDNYKIVLNIPNKYKNYEDCIIPPNILEFLEKNAAKIIVLRDDVDYGPITNLLYPLKQLNMDDDDIIIVVDDDQVYHTSMVSYHVKKLAQYPPNHAICFRGNQPMELRTWKEGGKQLAKFYGSCVLFPTQNDLYLRFPDHWHSVSYRRRFLKDDIFDPTFLGMTWNNDHLMAHYAWTHDFYFLCASYDHETDYRPVNYDGRGAQAFPVVRSLPYEQVSGCYFWRTTTNHDQLTSTEQFKRVYEDKGIIDWGKACQM